MSISINTSSSNVSFGSQYEAKISQLEVLLQTYQAQLQTESDLEKQTEIKEKIQDIQTQIKDYQAKAVNKVTSVDSSEKSNTNNSNNTGSQDIVEISDEGKALYKEMKVWNKELDILENAKELTEEKEKNKNINQTVGTIISVLV